MMFPARLAGPMAGLLVALPWLNPFTLGPLSNALPWLLTAACTLALAIIRRPAFRSTLSIAAISALMPLTTVLLHPFTSREAVFLAAGLMLVCLGAAIAVRQETERPLSWGLLLSAALSAVIGLLQYFDASAVLPPIVSPADHGLAYGNLRQSNQFSSLCWIGMAVLLWGGLPLRMRTATAIAALLAAASAASVSRTGIVQGLVLTALAIAWPGEQRTRRILLCMVAAVSFIAASVLLPFILEAATGIAPARTLWGRLGGGDACSSRMALWANVSHLIAQSPWFGWGWGELDYAHFITLYPGLRFCEILDNAHNLPLHLAVELGLPVTLALCSAAVIWTCRQRPWSEQESVRQFAWALLALLLLHSMLEYPLWYGPFQVVFGFALGWLLRPPAPQPLPSHSIRHRVVVAAALVVLAYVARDYVRVSQIYLPPQSRLAASRQDPLRMARDSWLFTPQVRFADLTLGSVNRSSAAWMETAALQALHYSPEPRVIERAIESATMLGHDELALQLLARYRAAFPAEHASWSALQTGRPAVQD
jgi:hypothetical protein